MSCCVVIHLYIQTIWRLLHITVHKMREHLILSLHISSVEVGWQNVIILVFCMYVDRHRGSAGVRVLILSSVWQYHRRWGVSWLLVSQMLRHCHCKYHFHAMRCYCHMWSESLFVYRIGNEDLAFLFLYVACESSADCFSCCPCESGGRKYGN